MELVAFAGEDKQNLGQISALINRMDCEKIFIVKDKKSEEFFESPKCVFIDVDTSQGLAALKEEMFQKLKTELISEFEVALSLASGTGKEHMALLSALLSVPVGVRIVAFTKEGVTYLT